MVFWRKQKNAKVQEQDERDDRLLHRKDDPEIEPSTDYESDFSEQQKSDINPTEDDLLEELHEETAPTKVPTDIHHIKGEKERGAEEGGWFSRLSSGLSKSSAKLGKGISDLITKKKLDTEALESLEDALIQADIGVEASAQIISDFSKKFFDKNIDEATVKQELAEQISEILEPCAVNLDTTTADGKPFVIIMCGVNGAGKTTTIGKLAHRFAFREKKSVLLAAADTFRAAAVEQLQEWADKTHCQVVTGEIGADAAAVAYEAYQKALEQKTEILLIDTAGRLHNKTNLMEELSKIIRVLKKHDENAPHACLLVLDGTSGQNAHAQVETFNEAAKLNGLIITKIDGAAKGGIVVALAKKFGLPLHFVGVGEREKDLQRLRPLDYAKALVGLK